MVLLYDDTHTIEEVDDDDDENYKAIDSKLSMTHRMIMYLNFVENIQITNYIIDNRTSTISGFIDPRTNKKYMKCDNDFYIRKNIINNLFNKHRINALICKINRIVKYQY